MASRAALAVSHGGASSAAAAAFFGLSFFSFSRKATAMLAYLLVRNGLSVMGTTPRKSRTQKRESMPERSKVRT
ncbi:hypothetical protein D3C84_1284020 [compost metagenome]